MNCDFLSIEVFCKVTILLSFPTNQRPSSSSFECVYIYVSVCVCVCVCVCV